MAPAFPFPINMRPIGEDMMKLKFLRTALLALATLASTAVMAQTAPVSGETVRIQKYPGIVSLLAIVATERGYCTKYGINCVLITIPSSVVGLQALLSGGLDVASPAVVPALQLAAKGTPVRFIADGWKTNPYPFAVGDQVSSPELPKSVSDLMHALKGKRIGVTTRGSGPDYALQSFLTEAGMKESDVIIVPVGGPDTAYSAIEHKQVAAALSYPPIDAFCDVLKTCRLYGGEWPKELDRIDGAQLPYVVRADYAEKNYKVIKALQNALKDAETFIHTSSNFDELTRMVEKNFKMDNPRKGEIVATMVRNAIPAFYIELDPKAVQAASDFMLRTGQLSKPFDTSGLVLP